MHPADGMHDRARRWHDDDGEPIWKPDETKWPDSYDAGERKVLTECMVCDFCGAAGCMNEAFLALDNRVGLHEKWIP